MSSFKRKGSSRPSVPGTKQSANSTLITSTGIASLDDILGGGLPLTCSLLTIAPDLHSSYGELVQKYFIAQGLVSNQQVCIIHHDSEQFAKECMWIGRSEHNDSVTADDQKVKIAWRYEQMKQFQTTVSTSSDQDYCTPFDLAAQIPPSVIQDICHIHPQDPLTKLAQVLERSHEASPMRICIPLLGSPYWGQLSPQDILRFLHSLRSLLRQHPYSCASVSLVPYMASEQWGGLGWTKKLGWLSDAAISLSAITADPSLVAQFPTYHGFIHIHSLPSPYTLTPASDKYSTLRGLSSSGENNLAFKCTRKRLVIETLHLDVEGGVSERRTTVPHTQTQEAKGSARIKVEIEEEKKVKRKVAFDDMF